MNRKAGNRNGTLFPASADSRALFISYWLCGVSGVSDRVQSYPKRNRRGIRYDFIGKLKNENLSGKLVGLFGCGDSGSYPDTFCDAMGHLYNDLSGTGCRFIGACDTAGYSFDSSEAVRDGKFVGLALDETNEDDRTAERIAAWVETLKKEGL